MAKLVIVYPKIEVLEVANEHASSPTALSRTLRAGGPTDRAVWVAAGKKKGELEVALVRFYQDPPSTWIKTGLVTERLPKLFPGDNGEFVWQPLSGFWDRGADDIAVPLTEGARFVKGFEYGQLFWLHGAPKVRLQRPGRDGASRGYFYWRVVEIL